jgi:hypothetical protein
MRYFLASLCTATALTLAPMPTAAASGPTFDSISWTHSALTISGVAMVKQTGSVHVTDPSATAGGNCYWYFVLTETGGSGSVNRYVTGAKLTSGTVNDGTWTMAFYLSSTADGTWQLTGAQTCSPTPQDYDVAGGPAFTVAGHHQPRVTWAVAPTPVPVTRPTWSVKGRVYDADTGAGMANVTVGQAQVDTGCLYQQQGEGSGAQLTLRTTTNASGYYALPTRNGTGGLQCLGLVGVPDHNPDGLSVFPWFRQFAVPYLPSVSAAPAASTVRAGTLDAVNGHVVGGRSGCAIDLQRLRGATAWRTVSTAKLRTSLRFTLIAEPPSAGRFVYRAYYPRCTDVRQYAASSARFVITAT